MDRLASITAFVRVAENGGFSAAARRLNLSTTTISDQVQALENTLGARLLNRTTRRVSLTEIGREYFERCALILHELDEADEAASSLQLTPRGHLRIYSQQGVSLPVGEAVTLFLKRYPGVSIDLRTGDVMPDLVQDALDLMVTPAAPPDSSLTRRRLAGYRYVVCGAPSYFDKHSPPKSPADLASHNCLLYPYSVFGRDWPFSDSAGNPITMRISGNLVTTGTSTLRAAAVAGIGLWLCPTFIASDLLASGALVPILLDYPTPDMEIVALYPQRRHLTAKVRAFVDILGDIFAAEEQRWSDLSVALIGRPAGS